uniref:Uncharacterized protein n=1 Tax=Chromera velia CCMP2878 TaxID=1169474 RepID=A0A0G4HMD2_9ALVE|mmetsp:Transcript_8536/g.16711  ORF Transcript_8536/g.16711 Transcript_8536/m.16711 type:complete len:302 (-) Transcript_8536:945-1850(-)|eukprot:Cvel_29116.t1-p1 / transcript=Cvel_29116.t1 / gene=Cvel_29116 / organism=Chromera_velia_CCMP2878 / gene_product=hypothetical protein / transcript_product=hypothetical protein / location=Cvel_scaffold3931:6021-6923(+) / protein_length=301 / sequence_SO=supercontig / SO=protein_coding / is_pseudo=false
MSQDRNFDPNQAAYGMGPSAPTAQGGAQTNPQPEQYYPNVSAPPAVDPYHPTSPRPQETKPSPPITINQNYQNQHASASSPPESAPTQAPHQTTYADYHSSSGATANAHQHQNQNLQPPSASAQQAQSPSSYQQYTVQYPQQQQMNQQSGGHSSYAQQSAYTQNQYGQYGQSSAYGQGHSQGTPYSAYHQQQQQGQHKPPQVDPLAPAKNPVGMWFCCGFSLFTCCFPLAFLTAIYGFMCHPNKGTPKVKKAACANFILAIVLALLFAAWMSILFEIAKPELERQGRWEVQQHGGRARWSD